MTGRLSVVGTPIGNLEDISRRALRVLSEADVIYCEDTRRTRHLLTALDVAAPRLVRLDANTETSLAPQVVAAIAGGQRAVLVSDSGMPTISDPGSVIVQAASDAGCALEVVPGPSALIAALALSGLPASQHRFHGFLPRKGPARVVAINEIAASSVTSVMYESPNRVSATVGDLVSVCGGERRFVAARELTKVHEEVWRGELEEAARWLASIEPKGEWVLLIGAAPAPPPPPDSAVEAALAEQLVAGSDRKTAVASVASSLGVPKRRVYDMSLRLR